MAERLSRQGAEIAGSIFRVVNHSLRPSDHGYHVAGDVATRLYLIPIYLNSLPPYWISSSLEQLCHEISRDLDSISGPLWDSRDSRPLQSVPKFANWFSRSNPTDLEQRLVNFFKAQTVKAEDLRIACNKLYNMLIEHDDGADGIPESVLQFEGSEVSTDFKEDRFDILKSILECDENFHTGCDAPDDQIVTSKSRHPARLCLYEPGNTAILVSAVNMSFWQEFVFTRYVRFAG